MFHARRSLQKLVDNVLKFFFLSLLILIPILVGFEVLIVTKALTKVTKILRRRAQVVLLVGRGGNRRKTTKERASTDALHGQSVTTITALVYH